MKKRKQWLMLVCIALAVCLVSGGMLYIRQKNNNKKWSLIYIPKTEDGTNDFWTSLISGTKNGGAGMRCRTGSAGTGERTGCGGTE